MPRYVIRVLDSNANLPSLERTVQQAEELGFTAVCVAAGTVGGRPANILTLVHDAPAGTVSLDAISGDADDKQQSDRVTAVAAGKTVISYGGVYAGGVLNNVAMIRA